jgi:hypothetical protein
MRSLQILTPVVVLLSLFSTACFSQSTDTIRGFRAGYYKGRALNTTANARGNAGFELYDINRQNGRARAYAIFSDGLEGEAWLTGNVTDNGELDLSGTLESFRMQVRGHLAENGSITADYSLEGTNPQRGNFEVSFVEALPADMADDSGFRSSPVSNLIGAWEVGGALPAQTSPITGMSMGVSFVDVHRLEFFPDGSFKHLWSHRHCDGPRCCSEQAMLETGNYSLSGQKLNLDITGGNLINTDVCNPKMTGHTPVKHRTEIFNVSSRGSQLCLQQGTQAAACYQKQA